MGEQPPPPAARTPRRQGTTPVDANAPWKPAPWTDDIAHAIRALSNGTAEPHQQTAALEWIVNVCARTYDEQYYPSERDTAYALGMAHVGRQIVKLIKLIPSTLKRRDSNG